MLRKFLFKYLKSDLGFWKSFLMGLAISASGSMILGALHLMAIQINIEKGWQAAILFSSGCALVEALFVLFIVPFTKWLAQKKNAIQIMEWVLLILFLGLSLACFYGAMNISSEIKKVITPMITIPTFFFGMGIRFIYPSMIPFWLAWNTVLVTRKIKFKILPFVIAVGVATVLMHGAYIFVGELLVDFLKDKGKAMLLLMGVLFLVTAAYQGRRVFEYRISNKEF